MIGSKFSRHFFNQLFFIFIIIFINFASQAGRAPQQLAPFTVAPFLPSQPWYITEDRPQHRELRAYS